MIANAVSRVLSPLCQRLGLNLLPVHFDSPVPDIRECRFERSEMPGIDLNEAEQLEMLQRLRSFGSELSAIPLRSAEYSLCRDSSMFGVLDSSVLYTMIRCFNPRRMIEVGSGYSTLISLKAGVTNLTCVEPFPRPQLLALPIRLIKKRVQELSLSEFTQLDRNDILFIDSSHVLKTGSDVTYEFLEILPRLKPGVIVHVHDIFLPDDYPAHWVHNQRFWNEQYALQLFLAFNSRFRVLWAGNYMRVKHPQLLAQVVPDYAPAEVPGSFWMMA